MIQEVLIYPLDVAPAYDSSPRIYGQLSFDWTEHPPSSVTGSWVDGSDATYVEYPNRGKNEYSFARVAFAAQTIDTERLVYVHNRFKTPKQTEQGDLINQTFGGVYDQSLAQIDWGLGDPNGSFYGQCHGDWDYGDVVPAGWQQSGFDVRSGNADPARFALIAAWFAAGNAALGFNVAAFNTTQLARRVYEGHIALGYERGGWNVGAVNRYDA